MDYITNEQKLMALIAHLAYLLCGAGFIIAPLIIFILKKEDAFVYHHAKQALVSHLSILVISMIVGLLCLMLVGVLLLPILGVLWVILLITSIVAAVKVMHGERYEYPFIQRFVNKI